MMSHPPLALPSEKSLCDGNTAARLSIFNILPENSHRKRRQEILTGTAAGPLSTKYVHGLWITMWMSHQLPATLQSLAHCPISRQRNL